MRRKTALIFGATGMDGSHLADLLLSKDYAVVGVRRRTSQPNDANVRHLGHESCFQLVPGDVTDAGSVCRLLRLHRPDEVYNLAAMSQVRTSFEEPQHTWAVTAGGCLNVLEAARNCLQVDGWAPRVYQASSSEMFGDSVSYLARGQDGPARRIESVASRPMGHALEKGPFQDEQTPFNPQSPYAVAKLAAHHMVRLYRNAYGLFACSGILFNHESARRADEFVTRKISKYVARIVAARRHSDYLPPLTLGNLDARRDWGWAPDYVRGMWLMLQRAAPADYVLATGETHSVADFLAEAFRLVGVGDPSVFCATDPDLYRPCEVPVLCGDATRAREDLGWAPTVGFAELVKKMVLADAASIYEAGSLCEPASEDYTGPQAVSEK
jgi:GDPmannose 4,6-dehydratase